MIGTLVKQGFDAADRERGGKVASAPVKQDVDAADQCLACRPHVFIPVYLVDLEQQLLWVKRLGFRVWVSV